MTRTRAPKGAAGARRARAATATQVDAASGDPVAQGEAEELEGGAGGPEELDLEAPDAGEIPIEDVGDVDLPPTSELVDDPDAASGDDLEAGESNPLVLATFGRPRRRTAADTSSLVAYDPLTAYVNEIRRHPLLTREEEHKLAVRLHEHGDVDAARHLITANLRLVVKIAHEYRKAYRHLLDLVQEGNIGLMQAVRKFDPYKGVKLSSYAAWWIRAYILKFVLNNWRLVKIGTTQAQRKLFFKLKQEKERLEAMGIEVDSRMIADQLQVKESEVIEMERRLAAPDVSLDVPMSQDSEGREGKSRLDLLASSGVPIDEQLASEQLRSQLREALERFATTLEGKELTLFRERLLTDAPLTLQEIGDRYGISRERARQIEKRMVTRLKRFLESELGESVAVLPGVARDGDTADADLGSGNLAGESGDEG